jgi:acetyltransferase-like isoleucine patch superfamily enzyme
MNASDINKILNTISEDKVLSEKFLKLLVSSLDLRQNRFHPLVFVNGDPEIGAGTYIGLFSEVNARGAKVKIGKNCDIASFVSINVADSHKKCIDISDTIGRQPIILEDNVFVGSHSFIGGGVKIGHHSVVGAGTTLVKGGEIPPYSLVVGNPVKVKEGYFLDKK